MRREGKKVWIGALAGMAILGMTGCKEAEKNYDVYFFNQKSEIAESLNDLAAQYQQETGKRVKVVTVGTTEGSETMRSELKSREYPTLFSSNAIAFEEWKSAGYASGAEDIQNEELKQLYESIPDALKLQFEGEGNYGIPYNIEGYGLIADQQMLKDVLDTEDIEDFTKDYKAADYEEFMEMVKAMDAFIKEG
ncbi:MAG: extracellular solute-binding protein, partial [Lachnospiraceae bacterium]|nr:extracellular solute-binding protein [Lachnospiraceae bacterium]